MTNTLTQNDVLAALAQFGPLDWRLVKKAMGPNWPVEWERTLLDINGDAAMKSPITDQLIVALELALNEIHHPGACRSAGIDITAIIEGVIKKATEGEPNADQISTLVRDVLADRAFPVRT